MAEAGGTGRSTAAGNLAVEIARVIERGIRDSQALVSPYFFHFFLSFECVLWDSEIDRERERRKANAEY